MVYDSLRGLLNGKGEEYMNKFRDATAATLEDRVEHAKVESAFVDLAQAASKTAAGRKDLADFVDVQVGQTAVVFGSEEDETEGEEETDGEGHPLPVGTAARERKDVLMRKCGIVVLACSVIDNGKFLCTRVLGLALEALHVCPLVNLMNMSEVGAAGRLDKGINGSLTRGSKGPMTISLQSHNGVPCVLALLVQRPEGAELLEFKFKVDLALTHDVNLVCGPTLANTVLEQLEKQLQEKADELSDEELGAAVAAARTLWFKDTEEGWCSSESLIDLRVRAAPVLQEHWELKDGKYKIKAPSKRRPLMLHLGNGRREWDNKQALQKKRKKSEAKGKGGKGKAAARDKGEEEEEEEEEDEDESDEQRRYFEKTKEHAGSFEERMTIITAVKTSLGQIQRLKDLLKPFPVGLGSFQFHLLAAEYEKQAQATGAAPNIEKVVAQVPVVNAMLHSELPSSSLPCRAAFIRVCVTASPLWCVCMLLA